MAKIIIDSKDRHNCIKYHTDTHVILHNLPDARKHDLIISMGQPVIIKDNLIADSLYLEDSETILDLGYPSEIGNVYAKGNLGGTGILETGNLECDGSIIGFQWLKLTGKLTAGADIHLAHEPHTSQHNGDIRTPTRTITAQELACHGVLNADEIMVERDITCHEAEAAILYSTHGYIRTVVGGIKATTGVTAGIDIIAAGVLDTPFAMAGALPYSFERNIYCEYSTATRHFGKLVERNPQRTAA